MRRRLREAGVALSATRSGGAGGLSRSVSTRTRDAARVMAFHERADPLADLFDLEPDDVHMRKVL